ncbi:C-terminal binding protein [Peterkaempfera bronchialis]|uniref:C-terminal binding protein n=1 Tax=Peterkaempfera bronchialis TaxID=2126346 RepID=UPI0013B3CDF9|nr:C-terminal binding protein [Peterkaempfera bronchialis]
MTPAPARRRVLVTDVVWPDLSVERSVLEPAGFDVALAPAADEQTLVAGAADADAILVCFAAVTEQVIRTSPRLRVVARLGTGLDNIDTAVCADLGIAVTRVPDYCVDEVATHSLALALALWRRLPQYDAQLRAGEWGTRPRTLPLRRLAGARVAVLGRGRIGREVGRRWVALGLDVTDDVRNADIVSLHLPLTEQTRGSIDAATLATLRPGAVLVNTGRGPVLDLDAVLAALDSGQLSGAAMDVFDAEPLAADSVLRGRDDVILTPHIAFYSEEALVELRRRAAQSVVDHFAAAGRPQ